MIPDWEIEILIFVCALREGNFSLYVQSLRALIKGFFPYITLITVHVFDLISLPINHPDVHQQMLNGSFSFAKLKHPHKAWPWSKCMNKTTR